MFEHSVQLLGSGRYEKSAPSIPGLRAEEHQLLCKVVYATLHGLGFVLILRGHARSHRDSTALETCAVPVGAGVPAKRPAQPSSSFRPCNSCSVNATPSSSASSRSR
ncbi:hypothetical protein C6A77_21950 [Pseudomonas sp. AFG_SD02_1510_Pfu_092]|nr:hypothetical protein C6A77_21950 [Pseudomonas sp. AFG_SD02_1510_Pfu_092]